MIKNLAKDSSLLNLIRIDSINHSVTSISPPGISAQMVVNPHLEVQYSGKLNLLSSGFPMVNFV